METVIGMLNDQRDYLESHIKGLQSEEDRLYEQARHIRIRIVEARHKQNELSEAVERLRKD